TLEQVTQANVILHVQDVSDPEAPQRRRDVLEILEQLGVSKDADHIIDVYNKIDLLDAPRKAEMLAGGANAGGAKKRGRGVAISAAEGLGLDALLERIKQHLDHDRNAYQIKLPVSDGKWLAWLHRNGEVLA